MLLLPFGIVALAAAARSYNHLFKTQVHVSAWQAFGVVAPMIMWLVAVAVAVTSLRRLVIVPLSDMRRVIELRAAGEVSTRMSPDRRATPELAELAQAFNSMADSMDVHTRSMESALATQKVLTREVHHRVKNNLQIVSSLISIQARDAAITEVTAAYALMRQRVNALALVHRWMYQDESADGVEISLLLADLSASLEHGADARSVSGGRVICRADRITVSQDTALPLVFLVNELVSGVRASTDHEPTETRIEAHQLHGRCRLCITNRAFAGEDGLDGFDDGARRIIKGLTRQLRSPLAFDRDTKMFGIAFLQVAD